ncbi:MAG: hypothetical protein MJK04_27905 [Psychrosphaera sp.]|nr:hypothetical protein [Psychrosphaera sp.]
MRIIKLLLPVLILLSSIACKPNERDKYAATQVVEAYLMLDAAGFKRFNDTNHVFMGLIDDRRYGIEPTTNCFLVASDSTVVGFELLAEDKAQVAVDYTLVDKRCGGEPQQHDAKERFIFKVFKANGKWRIGNFPNHARFSPQTFKKHLVEVEKSRKEQGKLTATKIVETYLKLDTAGARLATATYGAIENLMYFHPFQMEPGWDCVLIVSDSSIAKVELLPADKAQITVNYSIEQYLCSGQLYPYKKKEQFNFKLVKRYGRWRIGNFPSYPRVSKQTYQSIWRK